MSHKSSGNIHPQSLSPESFSELLRHINISMIREFDRIIIATFGHSAFDHAYERWKPPKAQNHGYDDGFKNAQTRFKSLTKAKKWPAFLGERLIEHETKESVLKKLKKTAYSYHP